MHLHVEFRIAMAALLAASIPGTLRAQQLTVTGHVVERTNTTRVGGALVQLGDARFVTDIDGEFRFVNVRPGTYTLTVRALGYRLLEQDVGIVRDTTLTIHVDADPIHLDSLRVGNLFMTVSGVVIDLRTGERIADAQVLVGPEREALTRRDGTFVVNRVPVGHAYAVDIRKLGYLPARIALITDRDTTFRVVLDRDPVGERMIAEQVERIETRSDALAYSKVQVTRDMLRRNRTMTLYDVLRQRVPRNAQIRCFFIDENLLPLSRDLLESYTVNELERVEIIDRGGMVRVYTTRFIERMVQGDALLEHIVYEKTGLRTVCF